MLRERQFHTGVVEVNDAEGSPAGVSDGHACEPGPPHLECV
jgi:hypothetical protein